MAREYHQSKDIEVEHIFGIINPSNIFTKDMKYKTLFSNIKNSMIVSLQEFLKYSLNVPTYNNSAKTILHLSSHPIKSLEQIIMASSLRMGIVPK